MSEPARCVQVTFENKEDSFVGVCKINSVYLHKSERGTCSVSLLDLTKFKKVSIILLFCDDAGRESYTM